MGHNRGMPEGLAHARRTGKGPSHPNSAAARAEVGAHLTIWHGDTWAAWQRAGPALCIRPGVNRSIGGLCGRWFVAAAAWLQRAGLALQASQRSRFHNDRRCTDEGRPQKQIPSVQKYHAIISPSVPIVKPTVGICFLLNQAIH